MFGDKLGVSAGRRPAEFIHSTETTSSAGERTKKLEFEQRFLSCSVLKQPC